MKDITGSCFQAMFQWTCALVQTELKGGAWLGTKIQGGALYK